MMVRGKILAVSVRGGRLIADLQMRFGEIRRSVEILQPYGMSSSPSVGADVLVFPAAGAIDHLVAICADDPGLRITGLGAGEWGLRDARGQQVVFRADGLEITGALKVTIVSAGQVVVTAPAVKLGSDAATQPVRLANGAPATKVFAE